jgi:hypothetical protein
MTAAAITKPCAACKRHFIGVPSVAICPDCEKDSEVYRLARKKGDKRQFIPYPELLKQWKARRSECSEWRRSAETCAEKWAGLMESERERSHLLAVLTAMDADLDPALALADELQETKDRLARLQAFAQMQTRRVEELESGRPDPTEALLEQFRQMKAMGAIPKDMHRRMIQLCHPDKHGGSTAATEVTRWLLEVRP